MGLHYRPYFSILICLLGAAALFAATTMIFVNSALHLGVLYDWAVLAVKCGFFTLGLFGPLLFLRGRLAEWLP